MTVPEEVEEEENLGLVLGDNQLDELNQVFDVEVRVVDAFDNEILTDSSDSEGEDDEDNDDNALDNIVVKTTRIRKTSVMVGSIKKGKYSR